MRAGRASDVSAISLLHCPTVHELIPIPPSVVEKVMATMWRARRLRTGIETLRLGEQIPIHQIQHSLVGVLRASEERFADFSFH